MLLKPLPYFAKLPDPRREIRNKPHKLEDIFMLTPCAVLPCKVPPLVKAVFQRI